MITQHTDGPGPRGRLDGTMKHFESFNNEQHRKTREKFAAVCLLKTSGCGWRNGDKRILLTTETIANFITVRQRTERSITTA